MKFRINTGLRYSVREASTLVTNIHAQRNPQVILQESFSTNPDYKTEEILSTYEFNRLIRFEVDQPAEIFLKYYALVDNFYTMIDFKNASAPPLSRIPEQVLSYLYPSRYCQSDKLFRFANHQFGNINNQFEQVFAITEWINKNVEYLSGTTNSETSAYDTVTQQAGVCRDFAHLGIALCRALTIPARYCSVYSYQLQPQDFHACFEAWLSGRWIFFDATRLAPLNGMVKIAAGRDAADTAITNIFGNVDVNDISINVELEEKEFFPVFYQRDRLEGISYDLL